MSQREEGGIVTEFGDIGYNLGKEKNGKKNIITHHQAVNYIT